MDLSVIYSKTGKGLRARNSLIGGLSSHLYKVLSYIDGHSKAEAILVKSNDLSEQELAVALTQLEKEGFIRPVVMAHSGADDWAPTTNFTPMVVEEYQTVEEIEANAIAAAEEAIRREAEHKAKLEAEAEAARAKALAEEKAKEKARAEAKVNARLEADRIARETEEAKEKAEAEAKAKAEEKARFEAERKAKVEEEQRLEAERAAKAEEKARQKAERKAQEEAEKIERAKAKEKANAEAKENARRELERIAIEAAEEEQKSKAEAQVIAEKTRLEAERKAKAEAAKLEAERKAAEEAEAEQLRVQAAAAKKAQKVAEQVRAQAEAKAKLEAEEKAKLEAKVSTSREIERIVRKAEEDRKKAEADAKEARQEAKRKVKAEEDERIKAESKALLKAEQESAEAEDEEIARAEAKENAQIEMERFAQEAEAERREAAAKAVEEALQEAERRTKEVDEARQMAEQKAQLEAEQVRARAEAEEKAQLEEKEKTRLEMERISREAEQVRQNSAPEISTKSIEVAWLKVDTRILEEAEDSEFEDEDHIDEELEKASQEIKGKAKQRDEAHARKELKRAARENAEARAKAQAKASVRTLDFAKWASVVVKVIFVYLPLMVLLLIGIMPFFNLATLVEPIEKLASESAGAPVTIKEVHASLWPQPHLALANIAIGNNSSLKIESVNVSPEISTLFEEVKKVESLEFEGVNIDQDNLGQPQQWINGLGKAEHLKVEQIKLKKIMFKIRELELGPFEGKVELDESKAFKNYNLTASNYALSLQLTPQGASYDVALTAGKWPLPVSPKIVFDELKAEGTMNHGQINFNRIEGNIYGGTITGKAIVNWSNQWVVSGNFDLFKANLPPLLKAFNSGVSIEGKVNLAGDFTSQSSVAAMLGDAPDITANFDLRDGKINDIDLERAVLSREDKSLLGPPTHFDKLSGNLRLKGGQYQYRQLALDTDQFHAVGNVDIQPNQDISGTISAELVAQSRRLHTSFDLAGKVGDVKRQ